MLENVKQAIRVGGGCANGIQSKTGHDDHLADFRKQSVHSKTSVLNK